MLPTSELRRVKHTLSSPIVVLIDLIEIKIKLHTTVILFAFFNNALVTQPIKKI